MDSQIEREQTGAAYPSRVTLFEDGVYRWSYDMDMWHNRYLIRLIVRPNRREAAAAVRTLLVALAVYASYQVYCHVQGIEAIISPSHLEENIRALLSGTLHEAYASLPAVLIHIKKPHPMGAVFLRLL